MNILFDQGVPVPLRAFLSAHEVTTAHEAGWSTVNNGELLKAAERNRYAVLVTTDQNLKYQQNLRERKIAVMVLCSTSWPRIREQTDRIVDAIETIKPNAYIEIEIQ